MKLPSFLLPTDFDLKTLFVVFKEQKQKAKKCTTVCVETIFEQNIQNTPYKWKLVKASLEPLSPKLSNSQS